TVLGTFDPSNAILQTGGGLDLGSVPCAELPEPAIVEWGPSGDTSPGTSVQLRFNRPMIPLGERPQIEPGTFTIDPPVAGELEWEEPTRLVFRPHEPLPVATTFTVNFAPAGAERRAAHAHLEIHDHAAAAGDEGLRRAARRD